MEARKRNIRAMIKLGWLFVFTSIIGLAFGRSWVSFLPFIILTCALAVLCATLEFLPDNINRKLERWRPTYPLLLFVMLSAVSVACGLSGGLQSPLFAFLLVFLVVPAISSERTELAFLWSCFAIGAVVLSSALLSNVEIAGAPNFTRLVLVFLFPTVVNLIFSGYRRKTRDSETVSTLYRASRSLGESLDLRQVLHKLLEEVDRIFNTDISSVRVLDPSTNTLVVKASGAPSEEVIGQQIEIPLGEGFIGWVAKTGEPIIINDISKHPSFATFPRATKVVASAIAAPIRIGERVIGVVSCASSRKRTFSDQDVSLLEQVADLAASAIERAELYQQVLSRGEAVMERMVDGLIVIDREMTVVHTNEQARVLLGIKEWAGESLETLLDPKFPERSALCSKIQRNILECAPGVVKPFTMELNLRDEEKTVLNAKVSPVLTQWNQVLGAAILLENITPLVRLTDELLAEKRKLEIVLENIAAGVLVVTERGNLILSNSRAFHILGSDRPWWWLGAPLEEAISERNLVSEIRQALENRLEPFSKSIELESGRHVELHCVPLAEFTPGRSAVVAVLHDITEIQRLEQAKSDFVSMVSHELRTPLTSIKAYVDTLQREDVEFPEETKAGFISVISRETERMIRLINDILDLSKIEAGRLDLKPTLVDLPSLASKVISRVEAHADIHKIMLDVPVEIEPVIAEAAKVEQVILNLLSNAIKYSPGGGEIVLSVRRLKDKALVSVSDKGTGIPREQLPYIFEKYHRAGKERTRNISGAGLGLYVSRKIVEAHGGRIWAESKEGEGTTVTFTLPLSTSLSQTPAD